MVCSPIGSNGKPEGTAAGKGAVAVGQNASANGTGALAMGSSASAKYAGSVAIGQGAQANADPTTAVGNNAIANADNSTALGANSTANGKNSVALGQGSEANRANSVSVGNAATGLTRQITNVAPGTAPTDAVNLSQLHNSMNYAIGKAQQYAATVGSVDASIAEAAAQAAANPNRNSIAGAVSSYNGQGSFAMSLQHRFGRKWTGGLSVATNGEANSTVISAGGSYGW